MQRGSCSRRPLRDLCLKAGSAVRKHSIAIACVALLSLAMQSRVDVVQAQTQVQSAPERTAAVQQQGLRTKLNESTVQMATAHPGTSYLGMAGDMAALVAGG